MGIPELTDVHPAWLPPQALRALGSRRTLVIGDGPLVSSVLTEVEHATRRHGGGVRREPAPGPAPGPAPDLADVDLLLALRPAGPLPAAVDATVDAALRDATASPVEGGIGTDGFVVGRAGGTTVVVADEPAGLLYGLFHVVRDGESAFTAERPATAHRPAMARRVVDDWDNIDVHPVMGQVERGYAGGSICWQDGTLRDDLSRVRAYARLLASCGVNGLCVNNVNVHATEARLLTDRLGDVAAIADQLRPYGIRVYLSVNFAAPLGIGGLDTADPLDGKVRAWWAETTARVYDTIPDFGGYVVKADSEGQPGPFGYGRTHADGANVLADALAPFGGVVYWRAFVYNHRQDWRDRSTDRARAAYDHFAPLDGQFRDNAILQVKYGPIDFQAREPVSPMIAAMPNTNVAVELQVTQEYTGQQRHVCYLGPQWTEILDFAPAGEGTPTVADIAARGGGLVGVSNVGDDAYWTGHPLAQANLYAFARLTWDPRLHAAALLDEWIDLTFGGDPAGVPGVLRRTLHDMMDGSWHTYERYTAPLGIGFMVRPGSHYGPDIDGYEYSPWGTYHFADRDGIGVDRTVATGTGFAGQYPPAWARVYESPADCPDELLLFFHHVPYGHLLHSGVTVIQHIYDTHFAGVEEARRMRQLWADLPVGLVEPALRERVSERLDEQVRCAIEWRDQVNTYFFRKSGVPDARGRRIY